MAKTSARLNHLTESVIREMTRVANQYGAINLSQGYPDFDPPAALLEAAERALRGGYNQYSITWGSPRFRQALAKKQSRFMGIEIDPDEHITVTCGSTEAMMAAMMTVCDPGDKVIIFSPFYENYGADTLLSEAVPIFVPLQPPDFKFDPEQLRQAFRQGAKALVLCNPSNPTGKVFTRAELETIASLVKEYDAFVITDEVYEHIVYAPHRHTYIASLPDMFERTLSCSSLSKTYAVTGWRLGYVLASPEVSNGVRKVHDFLTVGAPAPLQEAAVTALEFPEAYYDQLQSDYDHRRRLFLSYLDQIGLDYSQPEGAYYVLMDISPFDYADDIQFCYWLAAEVGIAAVPGSSFFSEPVNHLIRFNFAKQDKTLKDAGGRLLKLRDYL
ncbi:MAG TPA: aminotransferase class I/II-fold pyridoxal phosphate-dependent enzyme [Anaerolineales bacterium]|jgi:aminotransferase|nr:aminotransferase class I/II-fold pyridoxal phosphate-dependent enzyme [Anaerolineales bacterium]